MKYENIEQNKDLANYMHFSINCSRYYQFRQFAMSLNELEAGMPNSVCPTDSRLCPDIRKLENGDIDGADVEKTRLEEKQRDASKRRKGKKTNYWTPM